MTDPQAKGRRRLLLLALLFFAPVVAAYLVYAVFPSWRPQGTTNYGTLVSPVRPLPDFALQDERGAPLPASALRGKWTLIYVGAGACAESCRERLLLVRQVRASLNEKRTRVQRAYVAPTAAAAQDAATALLAEHPDLLVVAAPGARGFFESGDVDAIFLLDPLGNWLMIYTGAIDPKGLQKDIKKLLRASQIG